jgi:ribonuclease Z
VGRQGDRCDVAQLAIPELNVTIEGVSVAGVETWLRVPEWSLAIDAGRSPEAVVRSRHLALTHAHMDHAGGLAQVLALRRLWTLGATSVYAPASSCPDLRLIVEAWQRLHRVEFEWTLVPMEPGAEAELGHGRVLRALPVDHAVPSLGFAVVTRPRKLRPEYAGIEGETLRELQGRGVEVTLAQERVLLAASGDTKATALERVPELQTAEVVLHEATFLDDKRAIADAHKGGHTHLDELIERADLIQARRFVAYHVSQIYAADEARKVVQDRLPAELAVRAAVLAPGRSGADGGDANGSGKCVTGQFPAIGQLLKP